MPDKETLERAQEDAREGKSPSTQAGEFVKEEMDHIREGKHGAASTKQAIAIGLSKARRAGVKLPPPKAGTTSPATRQKAASDTRKGKSPAKKTSAKLLRASRTRPPLAVPCRSRRRRRRASAAAPPANRQPRKPCAPRVRRAVSRPLAKLLAPAREVRVDAYSAEMERLGTNSSPAF